MLSVDNNYDVKQNSKSSLEERKNNYIEFLFSNCKKNYNYDNLKGNSANHTQLPRFGGSDTLDVDNYELIEYSNIESINFKNDLIKNLSNAISDVLNVSKLSNSASSDEHIKHLEKIIPNPRKGTSIITDKEKHAKICNTIADIINKHYGNIINKSVSPDNTCNQIFDMVESLSVGLYREFTTVSKSVHITLKNMEDTLKVLENHYDKLVNKLVNKNDYTVEDSFKKLHNEIIRELKRQIGILRNLTTTNMKHTEKSLYEIIKNNKHIKSLIKETFPAIGTDEFSDKLSFAFEGLGSASEIANIVKKSLKNIGMTLNEFKTYNDKSNFLLRTQQLSDEISIENLNETYLKSFYEAINQLTKYFPKRKEIEGGRVSNEKKNNHKHINKTSKNNEVEIPVEYKFGGKKMSKRLEERYKNENSTKLLMINDFISKYNIIINNMYSLYTNIGILINKGEIPITDELHLFKQYIDTNDFDLTKELIEENFLSLTEPNKKKKIEFLNKFYSLIQILQQLQKYNKMFEEFIKLINNAIKLIESYQEKNKVLLNYNTTEAENNFTNYNVKYGGSDYVIFRDKNEIEDIKQSFNYNYNNAILKKNLNSEFKKLDNFNKGYEEYTSTYIKEIYEKNDSELSKYLGRFLEYNFVQDDTVFFDFTSAPPVHKVVNKAGATYTWANDAPINIASFLKFNNISKSTNQDNEKIISNIFKNKKESCFEFYRTLQAVELYLNDITQNTKLDSKLIEGLYKSIIATKYIANWYTDKFYKDLIALFSLPTSSNIFLGASAEFITPTHTTFKTLDKAGVPVQFANVSGTKKQINYVIGKPLDNTKTLSGATVHVVEALLGETTPNYNILNWLIDEQKNKEFLEDEGKDDKSIDYIIWESCVRDGNGGESSINPLPGVNFPVATGLVTNIVRNHSEFRLIPGMIRYFTLYYSKVLKQNYGLKNIISLFNTVVIKNCKNKYMSSNAIYENIINFMVHNSYKIEEKYIYFKLDSKIDSNLELMLQAISGKIISSINRNSEILTKKTDISIEKIIIGGNSEKIIIIPEIVELYKRLPLYADFYNKIFYDNTRTKKRFGVIKIKNSIWTEFINHTIISNRSNSETVYSDKYCSLLIYCINKIYTYYKSSNNVVLTILTSFIDEINNSFGIINVDETNDSIEKKKINNDNDLYNILDEESNSLLPIDRDIYLKNNQSKTNTTETMSNKEIEEEVNLFKELYEKIKNAIKVDSSEKKNNSLTGDIISAKKRIKENPENDAPIVISLMKGNSYKLNYVEYMLYIDLVFVPTKLITSYIKHAANLYKAFTITDYNMSRVIDQELKYVYKGIIPNQPKEDLIYHHLKQIVKKLKNDTTVHRTMKSINDKFEQFIDEYMTELGTTSETVSLAEFRSLLPPGSGSTKDTELLEGLKTYNYATDVEQPITAASAPSGTLLRHAISDYIEIYSLPFMYENVINRSIVGKSFLEILIQVLNLRDISVNITDNDKIYINDSMFLSNIAILINNILEVENIIKKNNKNLDLKEDIKKNLSDMLVSFENFKGLSNKFNKCKYLNVIIMSYMLSLTTPEEIHTRLFVDNDHHDKSNHKNFSISDKFLDFFGKIKPLKSITAKKEDNTGQSVGFIKCFNNIIYNILDKCYDEMDNKIYLTLVDGINNNIVSDEIKTKNGWNDLFTNLKFSEVIGMCLYYSSFDEVGKMLVLDRRLDIKDYYPPGTNRAEYDYIKTMNSIINVIESTVTPGNNKKEVGKVSHTKNLYSSYNLIKGGETKNCPGSLDKYFKKSELTVGGSENLNIVKLLYKNIVSTCMEKEKKILGITPVPNDRIEGYSYRIYNELLNIERTGFNEDFSIEHFDLLKKTIAIHIFSFIIKSINDEKYKTANKFDELGNNLGTEEIENIKNLLEKNKDTIRRKLNSVVSSQSYAMEEKKRNQYLNRMMILEKIFKSENVLNNIDLTYNYEHTIYEAAKIIPIDTIQKDTLYYLYKILNKGIETDIESITGPIAEFVDTMNKKNKEEIPTSTITRKKIRMDLDSNESPSMGTSYNKSLLTTIPHSFTFDQFKNRTIFANGRYKKKPEMENMKVKDFTIKQLIGMFDNMENAVHIIEKPSYIILNDDFYDHIIKQFEALEAALINVVGSFHSLTELIRTGEINVEKKEEEYKLLLEEKNYSTNPLAVRTDPAVATLQNELSAIRKDLADNKNLLDGVKKAELVYLNAIDETYKLLFLYHNDLETTRGRTFDKLKTYNTYKKIMKETLPGYREKIEEEVAKDIKQEQKTVDAAAAAAGIAPTTVVVSPNIPDALGDFESFSTIVRKIKLCEIIKSYSTAKRDGDPALGIQGLVLEVKDVKNDILAIEARIGSATPARLDPNNKKILEDVAKLNAQKEKLTQLRKVKAHYKSVIKMADEMLAVLNGQYAAINTKYTAAAHYSTLLGPTLVLAEAKIKEAENHKYVVYDNEFVEDSISELFGLMDSAMTGYNIYSAKLLEDRNKLEQLTQQKTSLTQELALITQEKKVEEDTRTLITSDKEYINLTAEVGTKQTALGALEVDLKATPHISGAVTRYNDLFKTLQKELDGLDKKVNDAKAANPVDQKVVSLHEASVAAKKVEVGDAKKLLDDAILAQDKNNKAKILRNEIAGIKSMLQGYEEKILDTRIKEEKIQKQIVNLTKRKLDIDTKINTTTTEITSIENLISGQIIQGGIIYEHRYFNEGLIFSNKDNNLMSYSNCIILYNIMNEETLKNTKKYIYNTISELPSRNKSLLKSTLYKSKYRFNKLVKSVSFYYWLLDYHYTFALSIHSLNDTSEVDEYKKLLLKILNGCRSMIDTCNNVINELNDNIIYYETNENNFQLYKNSVGLIPTSSLLFLLKTKSTNEENRYNFSNRIIFSESKLNIDIFPWTKALISRYNNNFNNKISINTVVEMIGSMIDIIREFILEPDTVYRIKTTVSSYLQDNNFIDTLIAQSEKPSQIEIINSLIKIVGKTREHDSHGKEIIQNVNDIGLSPINLDALKSEIPLSSLYIYSEYYISNKTKKMPKESFIGKKIIDGIKKRWNVHTASAATCINTVLANIFNGTVYNTDIKKEEIYEFIFNNLYDSNNIIKTTIDIENMLDLIIESFKTLRNNSSKHDNNLTRFGSVDKLSLITS